ncbi:MAG: subtilisin-like proprotein convertase family protein [Psychroserpens sp.]|jgi:subtilisin-like proprotein convertase family protein
MKKITFILCALMCSLGFSQTFTDAGPYDVQNGNGTTASTCGTVDELILPLAVTGVGTLGGANSLQSVTLNVTHTWNADMTISLESPSGAVTVLIVENAGGSGDDFVNVVLQDGETALPTANTDLTGAYAPNTPLAGFNTGVTDADGTWNLLVCDEANGDVGTIDDWSLTFIPTPTCSSPTGAAVSNVMTDSADFAWDDVPTATLGFEWGILAPGGDPLVDAFLFSGSTAAAVITASEAGLSNNTDYVFYVRSNCDTGGFSAWTGGAAFTTLALPPANDLCGAGAIALTPGAVFADNAVIGQTQNGATDSGELPLPSCSVYDPADASGFGGDVWYSLVVPADGIIEIETTADPFGSGGDSGMSVYSGACGTLVEVDCDDDGGIDGAYSLVSISDPALAGQTLYIRVFQFGGNELLTFQISAYSATLSVNSLETENAFTYFPNPVKNELTLNAQKDIQNVAVYNMLGQEVIRTAPNTVNSTVNMNELSQGAYFVKVTIGNVTETIRVIKQ